MVGPGGVVAERHRRIGADEDGAGVADARGVGGGVAGLHLEVLGGVRVDHLEAGVDVVDQDDARLRPLECLAHALGVEGDVVPGLDLAVDRICEQLRVRDEDAGGVRVVLGLADEVVGDVHRVGGLVGEDGDLGGAGLGVDAHDAAAQPLGGGDVDVAGAGDHVDGLEGLAIGVLPSVGEERDGLRAADGPDLVHSEERTRGEDGRVRPSAEVGLRR